MNYTTGELYLRENHEGYSVILKRHDEVIATFTNEDDAKLFLAAPAMLEALKQLKHHLEYSVEMAGTDDVVEADWLKDIKQALAKAEGK